jgi:hypothetical protein
MKIRFLVMPRQLNESLLGQEKSAPKFQRNLSSSKKTAVSAFSKQAVLMEQRKDLF